MAKKKKSTSNKKTKSNTKQASPKSVLPKGFWSQVGALLLIAISILMVVAWFNAGGPVLETMYYSVLQAIGYSVYIVPLIFIFLAIEIFRNEDNQVGMAFKISILLLIIWFSGLFGLLHNKQGQTTGGLLGDFIDQGALALVSPPVAVFIYILLIAITLLFVFRVSPFMVIKKLVELNRREVSERDANVKVMRNASSADKIVTPVKFKLNASVPMMDSSDNTKKSSTRLTNAYEKAEDQTALVTVSDPNWKAPSLDLLEDKQSPADAGDVQQNAMVIKDTLSEFDIDVEMEGANIGPRVTQFTLRPPSGVKLTRITALENNIALNLAAQSLRIEAPIPGKRAVGIEVPNRKPADVRLHSVITSRRWADDKEPLAFAIGKDIAGDAIVGDLNKMPHLLIAGQTGAGKSVMINTMLASLLYHNSPSDMKLILVDPKQVEMAFYEKIPHLLTPVITEPDKTISALKWAVTEMQRRYTLFAEHKVKDIKSYNQRINSSRGKITIKDEEGSPQEHENGGMPYIVIVIDELADMMMAASREAEALIVRLAQKARAVGIHLVLATQRPSVNVITGLIKANIPARIAFTVASQIESRIILDQGGAEKLLGQGDMLYLTAAMSKPKRIQGALVTDGELSKVTDYLREQSPPQYNDEVVAQPVQLNGKGGVVMDFDGGDDDAMYKDAVRVVMDSGKASASLLQRRLRVGYARAARLIETMEDRGIVGPANGARPRDVLISSMEELGGASEDNDLENV